MGDDDVAGSAGELDGGDRDAVDVVLVFEELPPGLGSRASAAEPIEPRILAHEAVPLHAVAAGRGGSIGA